MTKFNTPVVAVHVWLDEQAAAERGVEYYYSVSEVDENGDEIRCSSGSKSLARAWELATERADDLSVPAVEFARADGQETDRYTPVGADLESEVQS